MYMHVVPTPPNVTLSSVNSTSVTISWEQDDDTFDNFTVSYTYDGPCEISITIENSTINNHTNQYTITSLEEFSNYTLVVYAVNRAGRSPQTALNTLNFKTRPAGICIDVHVCSVL